MSTWNDEFTLVLTQTSSSTKCYIISKITGEFITYFEDKNEYISKKWGFFELNPEELYQNAEKCILKTVENFISLKHDKNKICNMAICTERNITVVWSKSTSKHLYNALGEDDIRCEDTCQKLIHKSWRRNITNYQHLVGLPMSSRWMGVKLRWLMDHVPAVRNAMAERDLMAGTLDSWLSWKLATFQRKSLIGQTGDVNSSDDAISEHFTAQMQHFIGVSNASLTMLVNLHRCNWDPTVCAFLEIDPSGGTLPIILEENSSSKTEKITVSKQHPILPSLPITALVSRESAALIGLITANQLSVTSNSLLMDSQLNTDLNSSVNNGGIGPIVGPVSLNTLLEEKNLNGVVSVHFDSDSSRARISLIVGEDPMFYRSIIGGTSFGGHPLSTVFYRNNETGTNYYCIETSLYSSENLTNWLRHRMNLIGPDDDLDSLANSVSDNGGVCILPNTTGPITLFSNTNNATGLINDEVDNVPSGVNDFVNRHNNIDLWTIDVYNTKPGHIIRASMEMVASEICRWLNSVQKSISIPNTTQHNNGYFSGNHILYVSGDPHGFGGSEVFCQILADIIGRQVCRFSLNLCPADVVGAALLGNRNNSHDLGNKSTDCVSMDMTNSMTTIPIDRYECLTSPGERNRRNQWWEREITASLYGNKSIGTVSKRSMNQRGISSCSNLSPNQQSVFPEFLLKSLAVLSIGLPFSIIGFGLGILMISNRIRLPNWLAELIVKK